MTAFHRTAFHRTASHAPTAAPALTLPALRVPPEPHGHQARRTLRQAASTLTRGLRCATLVGIFAMTSGCGAMLGGLSPASVAPRVERSVAVVDVGGGGAAARSDAVAQARGVVALGATESVVEEGVVPLAASLTYLAGAAGAAADEMQAVRAELLAAGYALRASASVLAGERPDGQRRSVRSASASALDSDHGHAHAHGHVHGPSEAVPERRARRVDASAAPPSAGRRVVAPRADADGEVWQIPVENPRITSRYGPRVDPITGQRGRMHRGTDFGHPTGTPVLAPASGRVLLAGWCTGGTGNCVVMEHPGGWRSQYFHLSRVHAQAGTEVAQGDRIGDIGSTGRSTGPHLHFQVSRNGEDVDPETIFGTPVQ